MNQNFFHSSSHGSSSGLSMTLPMTVSELSFRSSLGMLLGASFQGANGPYFPHLLMKKPSMPHFISP